MRRSIEVNYKPAPAAKHAAINHLQLSKNPAYDSAHKESMLGTGRTSLHNDLRRGQKPQKSTSNPTD
jgi:hypothetical protein